MIWESCNTYLDCLILLWFTLVKSIALLVPYIEVIGLVLRAAIQDCCGAFVLTTAGLAGQD